MKYIRTKVEIIDIEYEWEYANCGGLIIYKENENLYIADDDIIKTADTIEELCDELVIKYKNEEYANHKVNEYGLRTSKIHVNSPQIKIIYGAIWTEWGLKYVAKMNEEGELELL